MIENNSILYESNKDSLNFSLIEEENLITFDPESRQNSQELSRVSLNLVLEGRNSPSTIGDNHDDREEGETKTQEENKESSISILENPKFRIYHKKKRELNSKNMGRKRKRSDDKIQEVADTEKTKYHPQNIRLKYKRLIINQVIQLINCLASLTGFHSKLRKIESEYVSKNKKEDTERFLNSTVEEYLSRDVCKKCERAGKGQNIEFIKKVKERHIEDIIYIFNKTFKEIMDIFNANVYDRIIFKNYKLENYLDELREKGEPKRYIDEFKKHAKNYAENSNKMKGRRNSYELVL